METIILGLGNLQFADDGAGVLVARALKPQLAGRDLVVEETSGVGLDALPILEGFKKAFIVDAVQTAEGRPGAIYRLREDEIAPSSQSTAHSMDILSALKLGRKHGLELPGEIIFFGIEARDIDVPRESCSLPVRDAIPVCTEMILQELVTIRRNSA